MDVAPDDRRDTADLGSLDRIGRKQRRLGNSLLEVFENGGRLSEHGSVAQLQRGDARLRVNGLVFGKEMLPAAANQMDREAFEGDPLEREANADALRGP